MLATLALAPSSPRRRRHATPAAAAAKVAPMSVQVQAAAEADAGAQVWVKELRAALETRKDEFRLAEDGREAGARGAGSTPWGRGRTTAGHERTLLIGKGSHPFNLSYPGEVAPQAEKLARNLRKYADQMKRPRPPPPAEPAAVTRSDSVFRPATGAAGVPSPTR